MAAVTGTGQHSMFFRIMLDHTLELHPRFLGPRVKRMVFDQLIEEVEGTSIADLGFVVSVLQVRDEDISLGKIDSLTGFVKFRVRYPAVLFRPFRNEVLDGEVKSVAELGLFAQCGPAEVFIAEVHIRSDFSYDSETVSWKSNTTGEEIRTGSLIRLRILNTRVRIGQVGAVGSIAEPFLGLIAAE